MTGKNKEQFEKWLDENIPVAREYDMMSEFEALEKLPLSMQWGVYLEYYDSIGIVIFTERWKGVTYESCVYSKEYATDIQEHKTLEEAQQAALKKADEIANWSSGQNLK